MGDFGLKNRRLCDWKPMAAPVDSKMVLCPWFQNNNVGEHQTKNIDHMTAAISTDGSSDFSKIYFLNFYCFDFNITQSAYDLSNQETI